MSFISRIFNFNFFKAPMLPETTTQFNYRVLHKTQPYMITEGSVTAATLDMALGEVRARCFAGERVLLGGNRYRVGKNRMVQIETTPRSCKGQRATFRDGHSQ